MKNYLLALLGLILSFTSFSQDGDILNPACREKCSMASLSARAQQALYYQYPSMDKYDMKYLKLDIHAEAGSLFMTGIATSKILAVQPLDSFITELKQNMVVDSVFINGTKLNFVHNSDFIQVKIPSVIPAGTLVAVKIYYYGTMGSGGVFTGTTSNGLTYTATLSESYQAREWFPAKQILKDKIDSLDVWVTTTAPNLVGSNGVLVAIVDSFNNKKQYQWKSRHPINYYLPSIAVGNYMEYKNYAKPAAIAPDSILILNYLTDNEAYFASVKSNIDKTPSFIEKFSELYGLYPFADEKYGHCQANIGGGMEHQTMTTLSSFGSTLVAHELGHQWWGDNVTCATWNHIWLNEGFASYSEYLAVEKLPALFGGTTPAAYMQSVHNSVMSSPTGSVYVPLASTYDENRIFSSRLSYNKGSAIIHNLRFEMQDDNVFFQTLKNFQQQFKDSVATADDFKQVAETTSGKNFTDFFNQWYYGEGYPTFNITYLKQQSDSVTLIINETTSAPSVTPFFKGLYEFKITWAGGDTTVKAYVTSNNQQFKFHFTAIPNAVVVDPNNWVLNAVGTITNGGVVPVKLLSFDVMAGASCNVALKWKASNEQDTKIYEVEYSTDAVNFYKTGSLNSHGNISESVYQYDQSLSDASVHYFRLKIIDRDGSYVYSTVISLNRKCSYAFSVSINPNPASEKLNLQVIQPVPGNVMIRIFDAKGSLVYYSTAYINAGESRLPITAVQNFNPGTYMIKIDAPGGSTSRKFIKL